MQSINVRVSGQWVWGCALKPLISVLKEDNNLVNLFKFLLGADFLHENESSDIQFGNSE